ncbi:hypothetical protein [Burkholderia gladioli]|uniref:hypothetical protein n=1 Tax=Burkholderia gladioli TaxID=28095 RepID=UPI001C6053DB|nr:hypothetical protein [Burkholderia gladioli]MBW5284216.1 hypothetical protein [Burkholderia gladioli]
MARSLKLGTQYVEMEMGDSTLGGETRGVASFAHASTVAFSMTDFALMRATSDAHDRRDAS